MQIAKTIAIAFRESLSNPALSSSEIRRVRDPMDQPGSVSLKEVVPCYLRYCVEHPEEGSLVLMRTVHALAEYGRSKDAANAYLNFRFQCDREQRDAVVAFLLWAKGPPNYEDENQIDRAVRNWRKPLPDSPEFRGGR